MNRRAVVLTAAAVLVAPLIASCGDDDDDAPTDPTVTLFEGTRNPNVSTGVTN